MLFWAAQYSRVSMISGQSLVIQSPAGTYSQSLTSKQLCDMLAGSLHIPRLSQSICKALSLLASVPDPKPPESKRASALLALARHWEVVTASPDPALATQPHSAVTDSFSGEASHVGPLSPNVSVPALASYFQLCGFTIPASASASPAALSSFLTSGYAVVPLVNAYDDA